jgi:twitching motility protein PilT
MFPKSGETMSAVAPTTPFPNLVAMMIRKSDKVSDLIFSPGRPPQVELLGKLVAVPAPGWEMLTPEMTAAIANHLIGDNQMARKQLQEDGAADISYALQNFSRFRVNVFRQRGTHAIVMRVIPVILTELNPRASPEIVVRASSSPAPRAPASPRRSPR